MADILASRVGGDISRRVRVAVSMGDPNGIGPEILVSVLSDPDLAQRIELIPVGSSDVLRAYLERSASGAVMPHVEEVAAHPDFELFPGHADQHAGRLAMQSVARAVDLCLDGSVDAMTTCPISKEVIARAGFDFPGHTEFIAERTGREDVLMMMVSGALRVGLVSAHVPLAKVPETVTKTNIQRTIRLMAASLRQDFGIDRPRIAVLGLNPHAGDGGVLGREELEVIAPALAGLIGEAELSGPFPADGFFGSGKWKEVDGVVAMYHDQGLGPFKALSFGNGVNMTAGLPIVRTSPDHGTGFDIAGSGRADDSSLKAALNLAADVAQQRKASLAKDTQEPARGRGA
jgi:4-hydroxythreonine-4-phosphate dehydrogenase